MNHQGRPSSQMFNEMFLTRAEKDNIANWQYKVDCPGIASKILNPFYNYIVKFVPKSVSPNVLSFSGLLMSIFAWQNAVKPNLTQLDLILVAWSILMYMVLDDIDGKHSRNTLTSSPLGELVDHFCDCITNGLITAALCHIFGILDPTEIWLMVLFTGSKFALEHLHAFADPQKTLRFGVFTGPTEILVVTIACVCFRNQLFALAGPSLPQYFFRISMALFVVTLLQIVYAAFKSYRTEQDYSTLFGIWVCLFCQLVKFWTQPDHERYIENGIIFSTLTADLIMAKMANRQLHQLIPVFHMASVVLPSTSIPIAVLYFIANVYDISSHMRISIINPVTNIFVCGYYDGLHEGHVASLLKASRMLYLFTWLTKLGFGSKLTVGVHSDEDYMKTKYDAKKDNKLLNKLLIRSSAVAKLGFVDHVIPACPLTITPDFLRQYKIHHVGISDEYVYERDPVTGKITKCQKDYEPIIDHLVTIPRTEGISSSELRQQNVDTYEEFRKIESLVKELYSKVAEQPPKERK